MSIVNHYRIHCINEDTYKYVWATELPTECPTDANHAIDSTAIIETVSNNIVSIDEHAAGTGGIFQAETLANNITAGIDNITTITHTHTYAIDLLKFDYECESIHRGDLFSIFIDKNRISGIVDAETLSGSTVIPVSQDVIDYVKIGYMVKLKDNTNESNYSQVKSMDTKNNTITLQDATTDDFYINADVMTAICYSEHIEMGIPGIHTIGEGQIGGTFIGANSVISVEYTNKSTDAKRFLINYEKLY